MEATYSNDDPTWKHPHAFHLNLPAHHLDTDGIPLITKYAFKKSRHVMEVVKQLNLTEAMFANDDGADEDDDEGSQPDDSNTPDSLHGFIRKCIRLQSQLSALKYMRLQKLPCKPYASFIWYVPLNRVTVQLSRLS